MTVTFFKVSAQAGQSALQAERTRGSTQADASKTARDFEAMFLRQALEDILPSCESGVFGSGTAAGMWRSMLADQVSSVLSARGVSGMSDSVFALKGIAE
jgi:peptidoglycan hydrolase FlgJ